MSARVADDAGNPKNPEQPAAVPPMRPLDQPLHPPHDTIPAMFAATVAAHPDADLISSFGRRHSCAEVDAQARRIASAFAEAGVGKGDRVAVFAQNDPIVVTALLAAWMLGAIGVPVNPMNTARELGYQLTDSGAKVLVALPELWTKVAREVVEDGVGEVELVMLAEHTHWTLTEGQPTISDVSVEASLLGQVGDATVIPAQDLPEPRHVPSPQLSGTDVALLTYTSGTTGKPKGAMNTHGNLTFNAEVYVQMSALRPGEPILAIAPLFHITGMVGHLLLGLRVGAPIVLSHRFHPVIVLTALRQSRPVFTIGAITALMALADSPEAHAGDFASLRTIYSGGAPIAPALADRLEGIYGTYIHNVFGMSETASPTHLVPRGQRAPVDPQSGALSIGKPVYATRARIVDDSLAEVPAGEFGEIMVSGPQITPGYWNRPDATAEALVDGWLRTGDIGFVDAAGWFYLVDRKKDMINASGYKVWPREVEDVLYTHPAVAEAAVVGVADEYRGETVKAFVTLHDRGDGGGDSAADGAVDAGVDGGGDSAVDSAELVQFCRERMAAYKYPREVEILTQMPKTATGKILRRQLRSS